ncbi:MAG: SCO family protein [Acidobacteria bacterium]|jgi:protein SCO1/2|nr:SCO family protein [Acidobacteriota bacterium]
MSRPVPAALALLVLPALAAAQIGPNPPPMAVGQPEILQEIGWDQKLGEKIPLDLAFKDEEGRDVVLADYFGDKPVVLGLVYYRCPMLCTISLNGLARALEVLSFVPGQQFEVLTVSFDANEGTELAAAKKRAYMASYDKSDEGAQGWHFLTGDQESVDRLTRAVGFRFAWDEETKQFAHPAGILVAAPDGTITHYLFGVEYSPKDLRLALVAAGQGEVGNAVDQVLLYCFQYDPKTGRYSAAILNIVRIAGVVTLLAMAGLLLSISRRRRKDPPAPATSSH